MSLRIHRIACQASATVFTLQVNSKNKVHFGKMTDFDFEKRDVVLCCCTFYQWIPNGHGQNDNFFSPLYLPPIDFFFFWIDISPFLKTLSCSCSTGIERGAMQMRCTAPVRRALSNHIIFIAPGFILFPKVGLIRRTGFCWINLKRLILQLYAYDKLRSSEEQGVRQTL